MNQEVTAIIQAVVIVGTRVVAIKVVKTELNSAHILEVLLIRFVNILDVEYEVKDAL